MTILDKYASSSSQEIPYPSAQTQPVALVTGASSGFGLLTALELAAAGYHVAAGLRGTSDRSELIDQAEAAGLTASLFLLELDVTDEASIESAVACIMERFGRLDLLVNNAGMAIGGFIEDIPLAQWRLQMETNFIGLVAVTRAALPVMRTHGSGTIINVSSISGRTGFPGFGPYAASKHAVEGFSESLRLEMAPYGIRVAIVEPGSYQTSIWVKGFDRLLEDTGNSPYKERLSSILAYSRRTAEQAAEQAADPADVARLIVRIARTRRPRLRYPIGSGTKLTLLAKALLPWRWYELLINRSLKKY